VHERSKQAFVYLRRELNQAAHAAVKKNAVRGQRYRRWKVSGTTLGWWNL
jgi:hypothetical protein